VGNAADMWRTADAWDRGRPINRGEVHDHAAGPALLGLEDIPAQSRCGDRVPRSVRGSYYGMCGDRASAQRGGDKSTNDQS
jgi:hypothetical protein